MKYISIIILCLINYSGLAQEENNLEVFISTSIIDCTTLGEIFIDVIDPSEELNPLPYELVLLDLNSGEESYYQMVDFPMTINGIESGDYLLEMYFQNDCRLDIPINLEFVEEIIPNFETLISATDASCCNGTINVDIIDQLDVSYTYSLLRKGAGTSWEEVRNGESINDNILITDICKGRYKIAIDSEECNGYEETIFMSGESSEIDLISLSHVSACDDGGTDDYSTEDGEIHVNIQSAQDYYVRWFREDGTWFSGEESITGLDIGDFTIKVYAESSSCLIMEETYTVCCCTYSDHAECQVIMVDPIRPYSKSLKR